MHVFLLRTYYKKAVTGHDRVTRAMCDTSTNNTLGKICQLFFRFLTINTICYHHPLNRDIEKTICICSKGLRRLMSWQRRIGRRILIWHTTQSRLNFKIGVLSVNSETEIQCPGRNCMHLWAIWWLADRVELIPLSLLVLLQSIHMWQLSQICISSRSFATWTTTLRLENFRQWSSYFIKWEERKIR
jgi:hypothetical protein